MIYTTDRVRASEAQLIDRPTYSWDLPYTVSLHLLLSSSCPPRPAPLRRHQHSRRMTTCVTRSHVRQHTSSQGSAYVQLPRQTATPATTQCSRHERDDKIEGPELLRRERLLGPTPFLHTAARLRRVYMDLLLFFPLSPLLARRSLLLLGWTRAPSLPFSSGKAFRDTSPGRSHFLPDSCFCPLDIS